MIIHLLRKTIRSLSFLKPQERIYLNPDIRLIWETEVLFPLYIRDGREIEVASSEEVPVNEVDKAEITAP